MIIDATLWRTTVEDGGAKGTYRWMAPELLDLSAGPKKSTAASDVYAFALTSWVSFIPPSIKQFLLKADNILDCVGHNDGRTGIFGCNVQ